jgi:hypothetical protein
MRQAMFFGIFCVLFGTSSLQAYPVRCNPRQSLCEVKTKRLTVGDKIGIFSQDNMLVGIGVIRRMKGRSRLIDMKRNWGKILRGHDARRISDEQFRDPERFFPIQKPLQKSAWGAGLGLYSMGVGDGLVGYNFAGSYLQQWREEWYWSGTFNYLTASGEASNNLKGVGTRSVDLSVLGFSGGVVKLMSPYTPITGKVGIEAGFANVSPTVTAELLNQRVSPGTGFMVRAFGAIVYQWGDFHPQFKVNFLRLQNSTSVGLELGIVRPLETAL